MIGQFELCELCIPNPDWLANWLFTKVGRAGENVSQVFVMRNFGALVLDVLLELVKSVDPSSPARLHVAIFLHGNNAEVVFFVDPDLEFKK